MVNLLCNFKFDKNPVFLFCFFFNVFVILKSLNLEWERWYTTTDCHKLNAVEVDTTSSSFYKLIFFPTDCHDCRHAKLLSLKERE